MRIHFAVLAGAIATAGCTLFTGPKSHPITLSVTSDTLIAGVSQTGDISWVQFTIPVSVHNGSSSAVTVDFCLASVDAANGEIAWEPICSAVASTSPTVAPGATSTFQWPVTAATSGPGGPKWGSQTVDGTYQLRVGLGAEAVLVSNQFAISELTTSAAAVRSAR